ncbi:huntingtin-interacting protein 1-related protein-like isoform X1 [Alosa sapidissima]|uniref:huntingtin-interacting protein 1-related protein-like isoform X1 n=1 Tax=Alosa sapidissima TaxID=34773 RepID=UPI001C08CCED|nr:huntingtin-interacting protein 1-related protein-like isoform X1 [Alosa sapidissima]
MTSKSKDKDKEKSEKALAADKEQFVKSQLNSITKCINTSETSLKEKHARNIILGTHKEGGAVTFWSHAVSLPLSSNAILSWKYCHMVHKILRDGHPNSLKDTYGHCPSIKQMGSLWGSLHDRYGHIVALYVKFLAIKIEFHKKHSTIPVTLEASEDVLERAMAVDINRVYEMTLEVLDYMDAALKLEETAFGQLDTHEISPTAVVAQCRLAPLVLVIQDCSPLYHLLVKLLFKLHSRVPVDSLLEHRERFRNQFNGLTAFFKRARDIEFFRKIIEIPELPESPPNFLRAAALAEHVKPVVVTQPEVAEEQPAWGEGPAMGYPMSYAYNQYPEPSEDGFEIREPEVETLRKQLEAIKPELHSLKAEAQRSVTHLQTQVLQLEAELEEQRDQKQVALVEREQMRMELDMLRAAGHATQFAAVEEAGSRAQAAQMHFSKLKEKHADLVSRHADLMRKNAETVKQLSSMQEAKEELIKGRRQLAEDLERMRMGNSSQLQNQQLEIDRLRRELDSSRAQMAQVNSTLHNKEQASEQMNSMLQGLQAERDQLRRSVMEQEAQIAQLQQSSTLQHSSLQQDRDRSQREIAALQQQLLDKERREEEQRREIERLKRELEEKMMEATRAQGALQYKETASEQMNSMLQGLQAERDQLRRSVMEQEAQIAQLQQSSTLQHSSLQQDRDRSQREIAALQQQLHETAGREANLKQKLQDEQFALLQCAVVEAEGIVLDALAKVDDPLHVRSTCSPDYLINRAETTLGSIDKMQQSHTGYLRNKDDASGLLRAVTQFSHLAADTIVNGAATAHSAPVDQADRMNENCRECATRCLQYLKELKLQPTLPGAEPSAIRYIIQRILTLGQDLRPKGMDVKKKELGDIVDQEMTATSAAIEEAVLRMSEILNSTKSGAPGVKLEVNSSIIHSCSDLMKAVHMLVTSATDLQKDIVESGRGAASVKEFYAKNSCWTEGLISASKAVGWGATQLLDSSDRIALDQGKYEEVIVCSHEIAASTAQLVAASKVKADRNNKKLQRLQQASRHVTDMAAAVVTSTKSGQMKIDDMEVMDFSGVSLIKLKTEEMNTQVRVLELESQLSKERVRLGELRKKHYDIASSPTEAGPTMPNMDDFADLPPPPPPTLFVPDAYSNSSPFPPAPTVVRESYGNSSAFPPAPTSVPQSYSNSSAFPPAPTVVPQSYGNSNPFAPAPTSNPFMPAFSPNRAPTPEPHPSEPPKTTKKPNIFQKSGTLLKSAFHRPQSQT